MKVSQINM